MGNKKNDIGKNNQDDNTYDTGDQEKTDTLEHGAQSDVRRQRLDHINVDTHRRA